MAQLDPAFSDVLARFALEELAQSDETIYAIDSDLRLRFTNDGWDAFALNNGGAAVLDTWPLGRCILEAIPEAIRGFYIDGFARAAATGTVFQHTYQCPSPELARTFRMSAYPLERRGWLVVNADVFSGPNYEEALTYDPDLHVDEYGLIHQCAHCRKVRRNGEAERWDWLPALVAQPHPATSHGLCQPCLGYYHSPV